MSVSSCPRPVGRASHGRIPATADHAGGGVRSDRKSRPRARTSDGSRPSLGDLDGVESTLEFAYRRDVERAHGCCHPARQVSVTEGTRSDGVYEEFGVVIELDGRVGHDGVVQTFRDLERDNAHAELNLITLRYGSSDIRGKPCEVAAQVAAVLRSRGWTGEYDGCPRCRASLSRHRL